MSELFGKATGCSKGRGGLCTYFQRHHSLEDTHSLEGFQFLGAAFSSKYKKEVAGNSSMMVTAAFFGDRTCNNGQFFECLNMAQLWRVQ